MLEHANERRLARPDVRRPSLAASGVVGTCEWDLRDGVVYYDEGAALLHTGDRGLAGMPLAGLTAIVNVHPEDRGRMTPDAVLAVQAGSLFAFKYRIVTPDSDVCSLLSRGRIHRGADGCAVCCCGVLIDVTESRIADAPRAGNMTGPVVADGPIVDVADRCLEARAAIERYGSASLLQKADALLFAVGRELARAMAETGRSSLH